MELEESVSKDVGADLNEGFRAQIWFREREGGGREELPSYISHIHNPKINAYVKIKFNIFQIEILLC